MMLQAENIFTFLTCIFLCEMQTAFQAGASKRLGNFACFLACMDNLDRATERVVSPAAPRVPQIFQAYLSRRIKARQYLPIVFLVQFSCDS